MTGLDAHNSPAPTEREPSQKIATLEAELRAIRQTLKRTQRLLAAEVAVKAIVKRLLGRKPAPVADFHDDNYQRYIARRLEHLASLHLPIAGRSVLEVGAGIGELTGYFVDRGCRVCSTEVRTESLAILRQRYPGIDVRELDLENPGSVLGREQFDVIFCYGLLYHLSRPAEAIAYMAEHCSGIALIETRVSYGDADALNPCPEASDSPTQASSGVGCRPTRPWVFHRLQEHFPHVYIPVTQPHRAHFPTDWSIVPEVDTLANAVFIGSCAPLRNTQLVDRLLVKQAREMDPSLPDVDVPIAPIAPDAADGLWGSAHARFVASDAALNSHDP